MPGKNFHDLSEISLILAITAGVWGSILSFVRREKRTRSILKSVGVFFFDMFTNVGFTMLTYLGLEGYGVNELLSVAVAGFIGYQGTRAVYLIELIIADKVGSKSMLSEIKKDKE